MTRPKTLFDAAGIARDRGHGGLCSTGARTIQLAERIVDFPISSLSGEPAATATA